MKQKPISYFEKFNSLTNEDFVISVITLAELEFGVAHSDYRERSRFNLNYLLSKLPVYKYHDGAARCYGELCSHLTRKGCIIGDNDLLIASHALAENATLVTNNLIEFSRVPGLKVENWD